MALRGGSIMTYACMLTQGGGFFFHFSSVAWPGDGPYLNAAYHQIVENQVIPHYRNKNTTVGDKFVDYFSDANNKKEIMSNFLKLTVYIKDLAVETTEDVEGYSVLDLVSDIGMCI